jgi:hypothetical protein
MRNAMLATLALPAAAATVAGSGPAAAIDYPYCIQGGGWGVPGDCSYRSYAECLASATRLLQRQSPLRLRPTAAGAAVSGLLKSGDSCHAPLSRGMTSSPPHLTLARLPLY